MINHGKPNAKEQDNTPKSGSFLRRLGILLLVLCLVLTVAILTTMEDGKHLASLRRWLVYGETRATTDIYSYAADPENRYGRLDDSLLVVGSNAIRMFQNDGSLAFEIAPLGMENPVLSIGNKQAVVCDAGGSMLYILDQEGLRRKIPTDRGRCYYAARLNSSDYLAVTEQKSGYKARVSVYNSSGEMVFHFDSHENYITDAIISEDCRSVVAVSLGSQNGAFASKLLVYNLETAELTNSSTIRDGLVYDLASNGDCILALCDKRLTIVTRSGSTLLDRTYGNLYLHDYALTGGDFCALLLGRYQAGNVCTLTTYGLDGQLIASLELTEEVLDMSAAGNYLAVLYGDGMVVYNKNLEEYAKLEDTGYAGQVQIDADGTVLVISGTSAQRFLP